MDIATDIYTRQELTPPGSLRRSDRESARALHSIEVHHTLDEIAEDWQLLEREPGITIYQSYAWASTYLDTIGKNHNVQPLIAICRANDGRCDAVLAFEMRRAGPLRILSWLGADISANGGAVFSPRLRASLPDTGIDRLWSAIVKELPPFDVAVLKDIPAVWDGAPSPFLGLPYQRAENFAFTLDLDDDFEQIYNRKFSGRTRTRDRRKDKNIAALSGYSFKRIIEPNQFREMIGVLTRQKNSELARHGVNGPMTREVMAFLDKLVPSSSNADGPLALYALQGDGEVLATTLGAVHNSVFYGISMSITDGPNRKWSPGAYALRGCMRDCIDSGVHVLDFGPGNAAYKSAWHDHRIELFHVISPQTVLGLPAATAIRAVFAGKRWIKNSPRLWKFFVMLRRRFARLERHQ